MIQIALDGPAGAGKSTVARAVAKKLGINYMDTGAMYRAAAYAALKRGMEPGDREGVLSILEDMDISVGYVDGEQRVYADGEDVTPHIRTPKISKGSSDIAVIKEMRLKLVSIQQEAAQKYDLVMDGRDIGTYVLPNAGVKVYITASPLERARRRQKDLQKMGVEADLSELEREIKARDKTDTEREFAPLRKAEDAVYLDTTDMSEEEVIQKVIDLAREVYGTDAAL